MSKSKGSALGRISEEGERLGFIEKGVLLILGTEWKEGDWGAVSEENVATAFRNLDAKELRRIADWVEVEQKARNAEKRHAQGVELVEGEADGWPDICEDLSDEKVELIRAFCGYDLADADATLRYESETPVDQKTFNESVLDIAHLILRQAQKGVHPVYAAVLFFLRRTKRVDLSELSRFTAAYYAIFKEPPASWLRRFINLFEQGTEPIQITSNEAVGRLSQLLGYKPDPKTIREAAELLRIKLAPAKRGMR